jgi:serine/threonine protein kinase
VEHSQSTGAGQVLAGRYLLGEPIGSGGMGKVWRAHDELLHRTVAVKELTAGRYASEADRAVLHQRTQKEARAAARITHPGVVTVHDVLEHDDRPWIVMQYVDGPSLADAVKETGRIDAGEGARIGLQVLGALRAAHAAGVLHRDVKPGNILLARDGGVLLTDFGIAAIEGDSTITRTGELVGSIDYLAPERVRGSDPGPPSDLWSLGASLYMAVQGISPFRRNSALSTMQAVVADEPPHPDNAGSLAPVIAALLTKDPAVRPGAVEVTRMLREVMEGRTAPETATRVHTRAYGYGSGTGSTGYQSYPSGSRTTSGIPSAAPSGAAPSAPPAGAHAPVQPPQSQAQSQSHSTSQSGSPLRTGGRDQRDTDTDPGQLPAEVPTPWPTSGPGHAAVSTSTPTTYGQATIKDRRRLRKALLAVLAAAVVGAGAGFVAMEYGGSGGGTAEGRDGGGPVDASASEGGQDQSPPAGPSPNGPSVPDGYRRVHDPAGFSLVVPKGWKREMTGESIDYTPDGGNHLIRISIDENPDFPTPEDHMKDMEKGLSVLKDYSQLQLGHYNFRDQPESARWEFSWYQTEKDGIPGPRHAIDHMYDTDDNVECAIYMSSPASDWAVTERQFEIVLQNWQPPDAG